MKKTRKYFAVLLALVMTLTALPLSGLTASAASSGDFVYEVLSETNKTCEITGYTGNATDLVIPSELDGYTVTSIGGSAFANCTSLTNVTIPNSVTSIGSGVFENCESLTSITVTSGNPNYSSENGVLFNKDKTTLILYPIGKTDVSYTIPDSVTSIGDSAFEYCESLTSVDIPDSVTTIGNSAFSVCVSLISVDIPSSVTSIGEYAFADCTSLTNISVANNNPNYSSENGVLFNKDKTALIQYPIGKTDISYTIPDSVTSIGRYAFAYCDSLTSVAIPDSVTTIEGHVFQGCTALTSINIPDSVTSIGYSAFWNCSALMSVTIPDGVTSIGDNAFWNCTALTSVNIPDSVTSIGRYAFAYCDSLTSVDFSDGVTTIEDAAFYSCPSLTSITIPNGVTSIGNEAFSDCSALASITLPDSLTRIGSNAFYGTAYYNNAANWEDGVLYIGNIVYGADLADVIKFREGTVTLADRLYEAEKIYLPRSVKNIGSYSLFIYYDEEKEDYCSSTFYGYAGSFAETYAKAHGYDFVDITPVVKEELVDIGEGYPPELIESIYVDMQFITVAEALSAYVEYFKAKGIEKEAIMLDENGNIIEDTSILCSEGMAISSWDTNNNLYLCGVEPAEDSSVPLGDVNGDGTIDAADAVMIQRYDSGLTTMTDEQLAAADVNADGLVDAADAVKIQRYDAGLIASL